MNEMFLTLNAKVANKDIRREKRNGRDVIIVPAATLPDNIVMNGIKYPPEFIEGVYSTLNQTPAPVGHPQFNGVYVNAANQEAQNAFGVGAWNDNVRRHGGRVYYDKIVDVEIAQNSEKGRALLSAIEQKQPIHTSTGLAMKTNAANGDGYDKVAVSGVIDHDAFLLDEPGAATPEQGVGVFVNSQGDRLDVVNADMPSNNALPNSFDQFRGDLETALRERYSDAWVHDFNANALVFHADQFDNNPMRVSYTVDNGTITIGDDLQRVEMTRTWETVSKVFNSLKRMLTSQAPDEPEPVVNSGDDPMSLTKEDVQAMLDAQAETLRANAKEDTKALIEEHTKPLREGLDTVNADQKAAKEAEHTKAVQSVVNAKLMEEAEAKELPLNALNAMLKASKHAAPLAPGYVNHAGDDAGQYADTLPE